MAVGVVGACAQIQTSEPQPQNPSDLVRPQERPATLNTAVTRPPESANTAETLDTTTPEQRAEAAAAPETTERALGETVASLGSPTEPGFWLKTPLVKTETQGRVVYPETGKSVAVKLIPIDGPVTAGSRLSLPALRLIEAPLTGLPVVKVYAN